MPKRIGFQHQNFEPAAIVEKFIGLPLKVIKILRERSSPKYILKKLYDESETEYPIHAE